MGILKKAGPLLGLLLVFSLRMGPTIVYGADSMPKLFVPAPPFADGMFPCSDCHADMDDNLHKRKLTEEHVKISNEFSHAADRQWCFNCHTPKNRDMLHLADGTLIPFTKVELLCGQCHGTIFRDWKAGVHGKRTGQWNGKKVYRHCTSCHNPHSPKFKKLTPMPPPMHPWQITNHRIIKDQIPKNPLGNIQ